ncbi:MAG: TRAP transporter small permease subunit [Rhodospirillaceae bacterium]|nr:TRAP transporter small permease subunit [Rhodospirillaceae bacterium]
MESRAERAIGKVNEVIGDTVAWLLAAMVVVQLGVVILRYVFQLGHPAAQDLILYMHGITFMTLGGYALRHDAHVRVDVVYREAAPRMKAWVDLAGTVLFLWPMMGVMLWMSWPYVANSWHIREGSDAMSGLQGTYLIKTFILVFPLLLALQGIAMALGALRVLRRPAAAPQR